ncbi:chaperonin 10-like protein [Podospora aff. communis PSN243]|uniref:Chaperonin 10-like protein n=1 Tax=Podospora aff. communis PSN243 TaxID=3040156 RepID=A0AAV9GWQ1_9PEZI|nr:chaperonin 10-like protein [Podospora aff. communis PSN243]
MRSTVQASVLHGPRDLRLESRPLHPPSPTDVQLSILTTGLCGSDLHYYTHFRNGDILVREPLTLGHESSGIVTGVGSGVTDLSVGDRVALEVGQPCEECELCASGRYNICRGMKFRSSAKAFPHAQGTLQEEIVMPARWVHKLPLEVSSEMGALVEPLAVALHAAERGGLREEGKVLVFGAGAVGLLCAAVSKAVTRAGVVVVADIQEERVRFAVENGFADGGVVVPMGKKAEGVEGRLAFAREVAELVKGLTVKGEVVGEVQGTYECTGVESCMQSAIYATAPGGKIMIIGMGNPIQTLPISAASLREVDLVGVFRYANTYPRVIELLASKNPLLPDLTKLITQRFKGMDDIPKAFDMAARVKDDEGNLVLKVVVDM